MAEKQPRNVREYDQPIRKVRMWPAMMAMLAFVLLIVLTIIIF